MTRDIIYLSHKKGLLNYEKIQRNIKRIKGG